MTRVETAVVVEGGRARIGVVRCPSRQPLFCDKSRAAHARDLSRLRMVPALNSEPLFPASFRISGGPELMIGRLVHPGEDAHLRPGDDAILIVVEEGRK